jgi:sRNA-binding carbon storage regulator CsrA
MMLELTREKNEFIISDDNIKVTALHDKHGQVRMGIESS